VCVCVCDCARKGIWHKNGGMAEMGAPISLDGVAVHLDCCVSACVIFILHQKIQNMAKGTLWVVPDKVQRAVKWLCVFVCVCVWWDDGMIICLGRGVDLHMAQMMPLPLTISLASVSPDWFYLSGTGSPG